jgi:hypothetical protein
MRVGEPKTNAPIHRASRSLAERAVRLRSELDATIRRSLVVAIDGRSDGGFVTGTFANVSVGRVTTTLPV